MLNLLSIKNYALIESLDIDFHPGFSIITGETGAGKSILIEALSLLTGERADSTVLKDKNEKCIVEAGFMIKHYDLKSFFTDNEIEYEDNTILRRIISPQGKSRAFINDIPVNLSILKALSDKLVDIHSQHNNLLLNTSGFQLLIIDSFAQTLALLSQYKILFAQHRQAFRELEELKAMAQKANENAEYYKHRYEKLSSAKLQPNELIDLESEILLLEHTEEIKVQLHTIYNNLAGNENANILTMLKNVLHASQAISKVYQPAADIIQRLDSIQIELKDIARQTEADANQIEYDPSRLAMLNSRFDLLNSLLQYFKVSDVDLLIVEEKKLAEMMSQVDSYDIRLEELQKKVNESDKALQSAAKDLSKSRLKHLPLLENQVMKILQALGMPSSVFKIQHKPLSKPDPNGLDEFDFIFSANKNVNPQPLIKVASGGEISRVMLALKAVLAQHTQLPTILFDEIDIGVSGDIAEKMGQIMREMSLRMQVLSITHLPQVAACAQRHYLVYKHETQQATFSNIKLLTNDERITETAKMLSGKEITKAALENARSLISQHSTL